jgi:hypothetical protein
VPPPVMTHPDRWRLDQLLAREEKRMALAEAALETLVASDREEVTISGLLPQPRRRRLALVRDPYRSVRSPWLEPVPLCHVGIA